MRIFCQVLQTFCGLAVFLAVGFSWLWTLTFYNRINLYLHRAQYKPETFIVTDAVYSKGDEGGDSYWLTGTVRGREERLVPHLRGSAIPRTAADLARHYPKGTNVSVLYNPEATEMLVQSESLRVVENTPGLWEREAKLRHRLALFVLVPVPVALTAYLLIRRANRRYRKPEEVPAEAERTCEAPPRRFPPPDELSPL